MVAFELGRAFWLAPAPSVYSNYGKILFYPCSTNGLNEIMIDLLSLIKYSISDSLLLTRNGKFYRIDKSGHKHT